ncbi:MAG TPA: DNA polymerase/3'-5' exonuclease PolX, partial [Candidatus Humimicrobiaceae bacterium]
GMDKKEIVGLLNEICVLLELKGENFFKIRAYQIAAKALEVTDIVIDSSTSAEELQKISGIGEGIAGQISTLIKTGDLKLYSELKAAIPPGLLDILKVPKLGSKKVRYLYDNLGISTIDELKYACLENRLVDLANFGPKTQENILKGIEFVSKCKDRFLYASVIDEALQLENLVKNLDCVIRCSLAGSLRRKKEIIKDIDIVASTENPAMLMDFFTGIKQASEVIAKGETKSTIRLKSGVSVDIRAIKDFQYPYAQHHFTGSKEHNTAMRSLAKKRNMKMNEYGLFNGDEPVICKNEREIFEVFGMDYIEPEIRENTGEIQAALNKTLPRLLKEEDIRGLFHFHTILSYGNMNLESAVKELKRLGFKYCGIADHSKTAFYAGGIKDDDMQSYLEEIDRVNSLNPCFKVFKGIESDILSDGSLDYSDEILSGFDFVIIAIHSQFNMTEKQMTSRIIKGMQNRFATILAHPTGRLLLSRDPYAVNITEIIDAASEYNVDLEINSSPFRLDLDWRHCRYARDKGVKMFIDPDAHSIEGFEEFRFGVNIARKGWLEKKDIANTLETDKMTDYLKQKRIIKTPK